MSIPVLNRQSIFPEFFVLNTSWINFKAEARLPSLDYYIKIIVLEKKKENGIKLKKNGKHSIIFISNNL